MEIKPLTKIDLGELLLETVKNAMYIDNSLQQQISRFIEAQSKPMILLKPKASK